MTRKFSYLIEICFLLICSVIIGCSSNNRELNTQNTAITDPTVSKKSTDEHTGDKESLDDKVIPVFSGPGDQYYKEATIYNNDILNIEKIEGGWYEISYEEGGRGYVKQTDIPGADLRNAYTLTDSINQNVGAGKQLYKLNLPYTLTGDIDVLLTPADKKLKNEVIKEGMPVTIICNEPTQKNSAASSQLFEKNYFQIEAETTRGKERVYTTDIALFDLDNPLRGFDEVKEYNAKATYNGETYYSGTGAIIEGRLDNWNRGEQLNLKTDVEFNLFNGIKAVLESHAPTIEQAKKSVQQEMELKTLTKGKYNYHETLTPIKGDGGKFESKVQLIIDFFTFLDNSISQSSYNIEFQSYNHEGKMVIRTGIPIEYAKGGKFTGREFEFSTFLDDGSVIGGTVQNNRYVDNLVHSMYPELDKSETYSIHVKYGDREDCLRNPYGYYIIIDKNLDVYLQMILHDNTCFKIMQGKNEIRDITADLAGLVCKLDDDTSKQILSLLQKNGIALSISADDDDDAFSFPDITSMDSIAGAVAYCCLENNMSSWVPTSEDTEKFWDVMCFYANAETGVYEMDPPRAGEYEEYYVLPNTMLLNAGYTCFPDFKGGLPEIDESNGRILQVDQKHTGVIIGDNIIIERISHVTNEDRTVDAIYRMNTWNNHVEYQVHMSINDNFDKVNDFFTYNYTVEKIEKINSSDDYSLNSGTGESDYEEVINEYRSAYEDFELYREDSSAFMEKYPLVNVNALIEPYLSSMDPTFFSAIKDINEDGVDELIIGVDAEHPNSIYTFYGGKIIPLINDIGERSYINIYDDGTIYRYDSGGAAFGIATIYEINESGDGLNTIKQFEADWDRDPDYPYYDGAESLSQEQFNAEYLDKNEMEFNWSE